MQEGNAITFFFYGLTTSKIAAEETIFILVNLIDNEGVREEDESKFSCIIQKEVSPNEGETVQADFKCIVDGLTNNYYSLRFNSSEYISGIPSEEILLDPKLTTEVIERGELLDYSLEENKGQDKIPSVFNVESVEQDTCLNNGQLIITGSLSKEVSTDISFKIPLGYPTGTELTCSFLTKEVKSSQISCKVDRDFNEKQISSEQTIVKDGLVEILVIKSITSESPISCSNGLLMESEEKVKVTISFRQVSHFKENGIIDFHFT